MSQQGTVLQIEGGWPEFRVSMGDAKGHEKMEIGAPKRRVLMAKMQDQGEIHKSGVVAWA
jgi:hypothetical protein